MLVGIVATLGPAIDKGTVYAIPLLESYPLPPSTIVSALIVPVAETTAVIAAPVKV